MPGLTTEMTVKATPLVLGTLVNHYFGERAIGDSQAKDELLYDAAFNIVKSFLETSTKHTVEELQEFSNIRIPSDPIKTHNPRVLIPLSCCEEAANHIITVFGGEDSARKVLGGVKWWQVRGVKGVDCQWISQRKDWEEAKRRRNANLERSKSVNKEKPSNGKARVALPQDEPEPDYTPDMDDMRCMLYFHGGGYYFGSIDQQRYVMQRYAKKMGGRVFAVNYRLAPQYPFPCAIQDCLAAYLFLINPPPGSKHAPVPPSQIIIAGDSAGGGLALAVLQLIRDSNLPQPAGAVLISPWCDLTHSFASVHENTATDILPPTGLSMHKPSALWPPPSEEMTKSVRQGLADKLKRFARYGHSRTATEESVTINSRGDLKVPSTAHSRVGSAVSTNHLKVPSGKAPATTEYGLAPSLSAPALASFNRADPANGVTLSVDGEVVTIRSQIQLYTPNHLLSHPLVSPTMAYLGGLPPLLILASDKEVLRDEILYVAHKAANPQNYPINPSLRSAYPPLNGIESRIPSGTKVHLQVYDETCHVLPLFSFTTPAKFAYRSVATFCKHIIPDKVSLFSGLETNFILDSLHSSPDSTPPQSRHSTLLSRNSSFGIPFLARKVSSKVTVPGARTEDHSATRNDSNLSDFAGPRFSSSQSDGGPGTAGYPECYKTKPLNAMIRERVSINGIIRNMEPEAEIKALQLPREMIGVINEIGARRYLDSQSVWDKKFKDVIKQVQKQRHKHIATSSKEDSARLDRLKTAMQKSDPREQDKVLNSPNWSWAWATDPNENPPPSSLVARRDTAEAIRLSQIADEAIEASEQMMSGNNLWAMIVNTLTKGPDPKTMAASGPRSPVATRQSHTFNPSSPTSPTRLTFSQSMMGSTTSLSTTSGTRLRRASFGSLRLFNRPRTSLFDSNGDPLTHRQSVVAESAPELPGLNLPMISNRDDGFAKSALEEIAEVRVSEDIQRPMPPAPQSPHSATKSTFNPVVTSPLAGKSASTSGSLKTQPSTIGTTAGSAINRSLSGLSTPVRRKAVPTEFLEPAKVPLPKSPVTETMATPQPTSTESKTT